MVAEKPHPTPPRKFRTTVTEHHTIEFPVDLRRQLEISPGDAVECVVEGSLVQLRKVVDDPALALRGLLRNDFTDWDDINRFVQEERAGWGDRPHRLPLDGDEPPAW